MDTLFTQFVTAAQQGQLRKVKKLLPQVNANADDQVALYWATVNKHFGVVRLLLEDDRAGKRCFPDMDDGYPLRQACEFGETELVKFLLEDKRPHRALPDVDGSYPLQLARKGNHTKTVNLLLADKRQHHVSHT